MSNGSQTKIMKTFMQMMQDNISILNLHKQISEMPKDKQKVVITKVEVNLTSQGSVINNNGNQVILNLHRDCQGN
jgi:hypothetical protein